MKKLVCNKCGSICDVDTCKICNKCGNIYCTNCANSNSALCEDCGENLQFFN